MRMGRVGVEGGSAAAWRASRPPKAAPDPFATPAWLLEQERQPDGSRATSLTVFLVGRECPYTCVFCDLWQGTLDLDTPPGALPAQLDLAFAAAREHHGAPPEAAPARLLKLYNASNFFDRRAVPPADHGAIAERCAGFSRVVVESHAKLLGPACPSFAARLEGELQVAIGFESAHPEVLERIGKGIEVADLRRAASFLRAAGIGLRAFVLIGAPFLERRERPEWTRRTCELALELGAEQVVLIPLRSSPGVFADLLASGAVELPDLAEIEETVALCAPLAAPRILLDTWDLPRLASSGEEAEPALRRLLRFAAGDLP